MKSNKGFTLIELLVVVSLIIITVGVTGDIIISLVRSYNKTQIANEIEQNANFVMTKLEKELRNSRSATVSNSNTELEFIRDVDGVGTETITYRIKNESGVGNITREIGTSGEVDLINNGPNNPEGVELVIGGASFFELASVTGERPTVIDITLSFKQIGNVPVQFTQDITLESTVVVRGSY